MVVTILGALLPVLFVLGLGYGAGRLKAFGKDGVTDVTELVLDFALPASLFVSTATVRREALMQEAPLFTLFAALVALVWIAMFVVGRLAFRHDAAKASLQALVTSFSAVPFYGGAVLGGVLGGRASVAVGVGAIVVNVIAVPATTMVLAMTSGGANKSIKEAIRRAILTTAKTPYIIAPILGVALVAIGVSLPRLLTSPIELIGSGSSGIGLFVAGLTLATAALKATWETALNVAIKLLAMPLLFVGGAMAVGMAHAQLTQGILLACLPSGPIAVLLATRHKTYADEASSCLAGSTLGFVVTLPVVMMTAGLGR